jgi:hypothetical protein
VIDQLDLRLLDSSHIDAAKQPKQGVGVSLLTPIRNSPPLSVDIEPAVNSGGRWRKLVGGSRGLSQGFHRGAGISPLGHNSGTSDSRRPATVAAVRADGRCNCVLPVS